MSSDESIDDESISILELPDADEYMAFNNTVDVIQITSSSEVVERALLSSPIDIYGGKLIINETTDEANDGQIEQRTIALADAKVVDEEHETELDVSMGKVMCGEQEYHGLPSDDYSLIEIRVKEIKEDNERLFAALLSSKEVMKQHVDDMQRLSQQNDMLKNQNDIQLRELIVAKTRLGEMDAIKCILKSVQVENDTFKTENDTQLKEIEELRAIVMAKEKDFKAVVQESEATLKYVEQEREKCRQLYENSRLLQSELTTVKESNILLNDELQNAQRRCEELAHNCQMEQNSGQKLVSQLDREMTLLKLQMEENRNDGFSDSNEIRMKSMMEQIIQLECQNNVSMSENEQLKLQLDDTRGRLEAAMCSLQLHADDFAVEHRERLSVQEELKSFSIEIENLKKEKGELADRLDREFAVIDLNEGPQIQRGRTEEIDDLTRRSYTCPRCFTKFNSLQSVHNHLTNCLDCDDMFLLV